MVNKAISYIDRCTNPKYKVIPKFEKRVRYKLVSTPLLDEQSQRIFNKSSYVRTDNISSMHKYRVSDFCLENLQASGAIDHMNVTQLDSDVFANVHNMEYHASLLDKQINSQNDNA